MNGSEGRVWVEIYLDHLVNNYKIIKKKVKKAKIMAAIKADAYGHGAIEVARILESKGVYMFGVASVEEGIELRQAGIASKILILSPILYSQINAVIKYDFMPTISEFQFFKILDKKLKTLGKPIQAHIEIDTCMARTGIPYDNARESIGKMNSSLNIKIDGVF